MSVTFFINKLLEEDAEGIYSVVNESGQKNGRFTFLDLDYSRQSKKALDLTDSYLSSASSQDKFMVVIDNPHILDTDSFKKSYLANHFYKIFYFKPLDFDLIKMFALNMKIKVSNDEIEQILNLSGGISSIVKYLLANQELIGNPVQGLVNNQEFIKSIHLTIEMIRKSRISYLEKLGILENREFKSKMIQKYFENQNINLVDVLIGKDLSFEENGLLNSERLLKLEKEIIEFTIENNGIISKEDIADIKWEKDSYDSYSDDAIVKTMLRLNKKLQRYKFISVPTLGYQLINK